MHALTTNDIRGLAVGEGCYTFLLNAQGRIIADANVFCLDNRILLDTEPETRSTVLSHIEEFTIADDAAATDLSGGLMTLSIEGPTANHVLESIGLTLPTARYCIVECRSSWVAQMSTTGQPGFLLFVPTEARLSLISEIENVGGTRGSAEDARTVRIENGKPRYGEEITARFLALEVSQPHAISLHKGCYLGQEVVERVRSRNALSRVLMPVRFDSGSSATPGVKLRDGDMRVGEIVSALYSPLFGHWVGMAYIRTDVARYGMILTFDSGRVTIADAAE